MTTGDDSATLLMLGIEVASLKDRIEALESQGPGSGSDEIAELHQAVEDLASSLAALSEEIAEDAGGRPIRAPWWPGLSGLERQHAWKELVDWVEEVFRQRHPEEYPKLGRCWYRHPDAVDELSALRVAWHAVYKAKSPLPTAAIEWHDRWLPGAVARVSKIVNSCKSGGHQEASDRRVVDAEELAKFLAQDVARNPDPPAPAET
jgi:hypothetical protein